MVNRYLHETIAKALVGILFICVIALPSSAAVLDGGQSDLLGQTTATRHQTIKEVAAQAMPAVVNISTSQAPGLSPMPGPFGDGDALEEFFRRFFGERFPPPGEQQSLGSGFIISADGYIVTNNHVIGNAKRVMVRLAHPDSDEYEAKIVGVDELTDLALIKISPQRPLPTIPLGISANLQVGEWVIAIGNPFGLEQTVTAGIVSGKGRVIGADPYDDFIQTDAAINPGNSGGPLLNLRGQAVGVNSAILSQAGGNIGIGFAIPIDQVKTVVAQLKSIGKVVRGWLGVSSQPVTPEIARFFGLEAPTGALVAEVVKGGPAEQSGIQRGDIILSFNETRIKDAFELPAIVARTKVGERVKLTILRDKREQLFTVTIDELPISTAKASDSCREARWGLTVSNISSDLAHRFRLEPGQKGVVVIALERDGSAAQGGIQVGDVIEEVNRHPIGSVEEFEKATAAARSNDSLLLFIWRGDSGSFQILQTDD